MLCLAIKCLVHDANQKGLNVVTVYCDKSVSSTCCVLKEKSVTPAQDKTSLILK